MRRLPERTHLRHDSRRAPRRRPDRHQRSFRRHRHAVRSTHRRRGRPHRLVPDRADSCRRPGYTSGRIRTAPEHQWRRCRSRRRSRSPRRGLRRRKEYQPVPVGWYSAPCRDRTHRRRGTHHVPCRCRCTDRRRRSAHRDSGGNALPCRDHRRCRRTLRSTSGSPRRDDPLRDTLARPRWSPAVPPDRALRRRYFPGVPSSRPVGTNLTQRVE